MNFLAGRISDLEVQPTDRTRTISRSGRQCLSHPVTELIRTITFGAGRPSALRIETIPRLFCGADEAHCEQTPPTIKEPMKTIILAVVAAAALQPVSAALAQQQSSKPSKQATSPAAQKDTKRPAKPCPEYGEGFVRVEGTSSCVKVGGYVRFETSRSR